MTTKAELVDFVHYLDDQISTEKINADGEIKPERRQMFRNTQYAIEHIRADFIDKFLATYETRYGIKKGDWE